MCSLKYIKQLDLHVKVRSHSHKCHFMKLCVTSRRQNITPHVMLFLSRYVDLVPKWASGHVVVIVIPALIPVYLTTSSLVE